MHRNNVYSSCNKKKRSDLRKYCVIAILHCSYLYWIYYNFRILYFQQSAHGIISSSSTTTNSQVLDQEPREGGNLIPHKMILVSYDTSNGGVSRKEEERRDKNTFHDPAEDSTGAATAEASSASSFMSSTRIDSTLVDNQHKDDVNQNSATTNNQHHVVHYDHHTSTQTEGYDSFNKQQETNHFITTDEEIRHQQGTTSENSILERNGNIAQDITNQNYRKVGVSHHSYSSGDNFYNSDSTTTGTGTHPSNSVVIIAVAPRKYVRLLALWSQLECFVSNDMFHTIIISAPLSTKGKGILEMFVHHAVESIPHLAHKNILVKYYVNDRYDVGLWCDALKDKTDPRSIISDIDHLFEAYDDFVLINDSIMAIRDNFTDVLSVLRKHKLSMTSLNYSFLQGPQGDNNTTDQNVWLESVFRAFDKNGLYRYMKHACVPASHPFFCPYEIDVLVKKRCVVESMEIKIASLFQNHELRGLFPSDVPKDMIRDVGLEQVSLWHAHYPFWKDVLVENMNFPAMKVSNHLFVTRVKNRFKRKFSMCTKYMDPRLFAVMFNRLLQDTDV